MDKEKYLKSKGVKKAISELKDTRQRVQILEQQLAEAEKELEALNREKVEVGMIDPSKMATNLPKRMECKERVADLSDILTRYRETIASKVEAVGMACIEVDRAEFEQTRAHANAHKEKVAGLLNALKEIEGVDFVAHNFEFLKDRILPGHWDYERLIPLSYRLETEARRIERNIMIELAQAQDYGQRLLDTL